jgi:glycosyltransferase involved in cell wall biosynthesis
MEKILLVTYNYPPTNSPGVFRILGFVNYLHEFGYHPIVLTVRNPTEVDLDPGLTRFIRRDVEVHRTRSLDLGGLAVALSRVTRAVIPTRRPVKAEAASGAQKGASRGGKTLSGAVLAMLNFPDSRVGWVPFALSKGYSLLRRSGAKFVLTSSPPHSTQLIGLGLKLLRPGVTWISDYRDPWVDNLFTRPAKPLPIDRAERSLERGAIRKADLLVANTDINKRNLLARFPFLGEDKVVVIANGFDSQDFAGLAGRAPEVTEGPIRIVYSGSLYSGMMDPLLEAVVALDEDLPEFRRRVSFLFVGFHNSEDIEKVNKMGLQDIMTFTGVVPYRESLSHALSADLLLLLLPGRPGIGHCVPSKLYVYMAAKKPVLAVVPNGNAADIVRKLGLGAVIPPSYPAALVSYLRSLLAERPRYQPVGNALAEYERRHLVGKLAEAITHIRSW